ncbi:MAG TPA: SH3 domain-containing protein [Herpetosiphonaceae bacterium]
MASPTTPILANRYHLDSIVYSDSAVVAYQARDQILNRTVTVELLRSEKAKDSTAVQRMLDKARNAAIANLPHVAALYDQNSVDQRPFLVLEEMAGPPLADLVPLSPQQAIMLVEKMAETLEAGLSYQQPLPEINDQTIRISHEGRIQVLDLGLDQTPPHPGYAVKALGQLLSMSIAGASDLSRITPLRKLAERATNGEYQSIGDLLMELRSLNQRANTPTTVIPRTHPTIPVPDSARSAPQPARPAPTQSSTTRPAPAVSAPRGAPITPPMVQEEPEPAPRRSLLGIVAAVVVTLLLVAGTIAVWGGSDGNETTAEPSPSAVVGESPAASAAASAAPANPEQIFVVNTAGQRPLVVRSAPGTDSARVGSLGYGTQVEVIGGPQAANGYNWVQIRTPNLTGWCISEALRKP